MIQPYQVMDVKSRVYRVNASDPMDAMQTIATRHNVEVIAWRESRAAEDSIRVGILNDGRSD